MVRVTASRTFCWPRRLFSHVGALASSKSAMKTLALELSALIIILRSGGPVISTRRSVRSGRIGATVQSESRICFVSGRKSGRRPASSSCWRWRRRAKRRCRSGDRKSTRLNSSHVEISYAVFCLKKKKKRIYIDLGFLEELHKQLGASGGPCAQAYILAH